MAEKHVSVGLKMSQGVAEMAQKKNKKKRKFLFQEWGESKPSGARNVNVGSHSVHFIYGSSK